MTKTIAAIAAATLLAGCGGASGNTPAPKNTPPTISTRDDATLTQIDVEVGNGKVPCIIASSSTANARGLSITCDWDVRR